MEAGAKVNMAGSGMEAGELMRPDTIAERQAKREPTWDECGIEQKINRMREVLMTLVSQAQFAGTHAHEALKIAKAHQHGGRGEVVLPVIEMIGDLVGREYSAHPFERIRRLLA